MSVLSKTNDYYFLLFSRSFRTYKLHLPVAIHVRIEMIFISLIFRLLVVSVILKRIKSAICVVLNHHKRYMHDLDTDPSQPHTVLVSWTNLNTEQFLSFRTLKSYLIEDKDQNGNVMAANCLATQVVRISAAIVSLNFEDYLRTAPVWFLAYIANHFYHQHVA